MRIGATGFQVIFGAVLAACGNGSGLEVVVHNDVDGVTEVRLYVAEGPGTTVSIASKNLRSTTQTERREGTALLREPYLDGLQIAAGSAKVFYFEPGEPIDASLTLVAVGFHADEPVAFAQAFEVTVPTDLIRREDLFLVAAPTTMFASTERQIELWGPASDPQACLATYDATHTPPSVFIRPTSADIDCDGLQGAVDCDKTAFGGAPTSGVPIARSATETTCTDKITVLSAGMASDVCVWGVQACTDGVGPSGACSTSLSHYCTPQQVCGAATTETAVAMAAQTASLECVINIDADGAVCGGSESVELPGFFNTTLDGCADEAMWNFGDGWSTDPVVENYKLRMTVSGVNPCSLSLEVSRASGSSANPFVPEFAGLYAVDFLGRRAGGGSGAIMPIHFTIVPQLGGCADLDNMSCSAGAGGTEGVAACICPTCL